MDWFRYRSEFDCQKFHGSPVPVCRFLHDTKRSISITRSVGQIETTPFKNGNISDDVANVQHGLNCIPVAAGGPLGFLKEDGICGPKTRSAIGAFQRKQFPGWPADGRIDPDQKTIRRINQLITDSTWPTNDLLGRARTNAPIALARVNTALRRLDMIASAYQNPTSLFANSPVKRSGDWHFKLHRARNPLENIWTIQQVYRRMNEALSKYIAGSFPLFIIAHRPRGSHDTERGEDEALAYASPGGYSFMLDEEATNEPGRYITVADERFGHLAVIIHELGHYCGGRHKSGAAILHVSSPSPKPNGTAKENGTRNYRDMSPEDALRNVYSYQVFALPEMGFDPPDGPI